MKKQSREEELSSLVGELIDMLETVETSDGGCEFHPTTISSCRTFHVERIGTIMRRLTKLVRGRQPKKGSKA